MWENERTFFFRHKRQKKLLRAHKNTQKGFEVSFCGTNPKREEEDAYLHLGAIDEDVFGSTHTHTHTHTHTQILIVRKRESGLYRE